jgi:hypothetical protein
MEIKGITLDPKLFIKKEKKEKKENLLHLSTFKSPIEDGDSSDKVTLPRALKMHEGVRTTEPKIPKKRVITTTQNWKFSTDQLNPQKQLEYVKQIIDQNIVDENPCKFIKQQIQQKLGGYKAQDLKKEKYDEIRFIKHEQVLQLMIEVENQCYYCKEAVHVLYENVREPKQWTLERLDNEHGHNDGNVVIACLACNLRRRTMHPERYLFTKQLTISKLS